ncbi:MAG: hypothetical protein RJB38_559 [Pseudomonadota bacterium]|jgi:UPF0755 protein
MRSSSSNRRWIFALIPLLGVIALGIPTVQLARFGLEPANSEGSTTTIFVGRGMGPTELALQLEKTQTISSAKSFVLLGRVLRKWKNIKMGEYEVSPRMSPLEIFELLGSGQSIQHPITIREGENIFEIADAIERSGLTSRARTLELCRSPEFMSKLGFKAPLPPSLEGYLFPETYHFTRLQSPEEMLAIMTRKYRSVWADLQSKYSAQIEQLGLTEHQIVTLASMIEKETGAAEERPMISSVFHNRLQKKMRLQSDPTTIYGMWENYQGNIRKQDLLTPTPFNTYTTPALPIGPIANPGRLALEAALNPSMSEFLFFVSQNDGRHVFTKSFEEHSQAVRKFQLDPKAREGKSWRDLTKTALETIKRSEN